MWDEREGILGRWPPNRLLASGSMVEPTERSQNEEEANLESSGRIQIDAEKGHCHLVTHLPGL